MTDKSQRTSESLLKVTNLRVHFPIRGGFFKSPAGSVKAVDDVTFSMNPGETLGIVGESGCGKTTLGNAILGLLKPTSGAIEFEGQDILTQSNEARRRLSQRMQVIFQDPVASLNPKMRVGESVGEPLRIHLGLRGGELRGRVQDLLETVGLKREHVYRHPHEFSGGQRQRLVIARALALQPRLIVCDEPVSALDVSVQSQILNLLNGLQKEMSMAYLFISHNLSVIRHISDRTAVLYLGRIMETADTDTLFSSPLHPYTDALMSAIPMPDPVVQRSRRRRLLVGELPSPANPPHGCVFHTRCPDARDRCREERPALRNVQGDQWVACHRF